MRNKREEQFNTINNSAAELMATREEFVERFRKWLDKVMQEKSLTGYRMILLLQTPTQEVYPMCKTDRDWEDVLIWMLLYACHFLIFSLKYPLSDTAKDTEDDHLLNWPTIGVLSKKCYLQNDQAS